MGHKRQVTFRPQGCYTQTQMRLPKAMEGDLVGVQLSHGLVVQISLLLHLWSTVFAQERLSTHQGLTGPVQAVCVHKASCLWAQGSLPTLDHTQEECTCAPVYMYAYTYIDTGMCMYTYV